MPLPTLVLSRHCHRIAAVTALLCGWLIAISPAQTHSPQPTKTGNFATLSAKADAARDANQLDEAAALYRRALALRPSWAEGWWSLGTLEYDQDHYAKAAYAFQKFIPLQSSNGTAHAMLGLCEFELGHDKAALEQIEKGKSLGLQKNAEVWNVVLYHEGILLQRKGSFQAAQDTLEGLCLEAGSNDKVAALLGMSLLRSKEKEPPAPGSTDSDVILRVGRAACLAGQKKYDDARPGFEALVAQYPTYPNLHYAYGLFLIELHDVPGAVEEFKQEVAGHPDDVVARLRIAAVEYKHDSKAGIPYAEEAVTRDPQQPFGHYLLGLLRLDTDDYQGAIPELEIAQKGWPREPKIYFALGTAYSRAGRRQDAARARATFQRLTEKAGNAENTATGAANEPRDPLKDAPAPPE